MEQPILTFLSPKNVTEIIKKLSVKVLYEYLSRDYLYGHSVI